MADTDPTDPTDPTDTDKDTDGDNGKAPVRYHSVTSSSRSTTIFVVAVVVIGTIAGVIRYRSKSATQQRLVRKVKQCKLDKLDKQTKSGELPVSAECKEHLAKLAAKMPDGCSELLESVQKEKERTPRNLLLYAMLSGRSRLWKDKSIDAKALEGDECLEKAIELIHQTHRDKKEAPGSAISGLDWYNIKLLDQLESWVIRTNVVDKLSLQSAMNIYDRLHTDAARLRKALPAKADQDNVTKALRKALRPRMAQVYDRVVKARLAQPGQSKAEAAHQMPAHLVEDIAHELAPTAPLGKKVLEMHLVSLPLGAAGEEYLVRWHRAIFQQHLLKRPAWQAAVVARLEKLSVHHLGLLLKLVKAYPELPLRAKGKLPSWSERSRVMLSAWNDPSHRLVRDLVPAMLRLAARKLPDAPMLRLLLTRDLRFPPSVQQWLARRWRKGGQAGELARAGVVAALTLGRAQHQGFAWLRKTADFPKHAWLLGALRPGSCAAGCPNPLKLRLAERANLAAGRKKHNLYLERAQLEAQLKSTDPNQRAWALVSAAYYPMKDRLVLLEPALTAGEPSVRAFAALALSLGLIARADINTAAERLTKLNRDPSWLVRLVVFHRLWLLKRDEDLKPFLADPTPQIVAGWRKRLETWKLEDLVALLQRKGRAAGVVLPVLASRAKLEKKPWPIDWKAISALANHPDPWVRLQLLKHFGAGGKALLDWGSLLGAKELAVRAAALDFWVDQPVSKAIIKHEVRLVKLLDDPHYGIKRLAALLLPRLGAKTALPALGKLRKHPACPLRNLAGEATSKLTGKPFKKTPCATTLDGL